MKMGFDREQALIALRAARGDWKVAAFNLNVEKLVNLGFTREEAHTALSNANGDVEAAASNLVEKENCRKSSD